jgi:hypothetical protein
VKNQTEIDKLVEELKRRSAINLLQSPEKSIEISTKTLSSDGRKLAGIKRAMLSLDYLTETEKQDRLLITAKSLREIASKEPDLPVLWYSKNFKEGKYDYYRSYPFLLINTSIHLRLSVEEVKYLVENHERYRWWVAKTWNITHNNVFKEDEELQGPFSLEEARAVLEKLRSPYDPKRTHFVEAEIVVTDERLEKLIDEVQLQYDLQHYLPNSIKRGLVEFGIISKEEKESIIADEQAPMILGSHYDIIHFGDDPQNWANRLKESVEKSIGLLGALQRKMALMNKIESGVVKYGGWEKFQNDCKERLIQLLLKRQQEKKNPPPKLESNTEEAA